jgi:fatty-acyl-CoA synthase
MSGTVVDALARRVRTVPEHPAIDFDGDVDRMVEMINDRLADHNVPRYVIAHDGPLPRTASGKIAKRELRGAYADAPKRFPKVR